MEETVELCPQSACVPFTALVHQPKNIEIEAKEDFEFSKALERVYPLVRIICSYLPYSDLGNVRKLSDTWKVYAEEEMTRRNFPSWFQLVRSGTKRNTLMRTPNYNLASPGMGITLLNYDLMSLRKYVCVHKGDEELERKSLYSHIADDIAKPTSDFVCISLKTVYECIPLKVTTALYSWFHIPDIPNVRILPFYFTSKTNSKDFFTEALQEHEVIDTLLIFSIRFPRKQIRDMAELIQKRQQLNLSVGGGVVWGIKSNSCNRKVIKRTDLFCIAFIRDSRLEEDNFFSASCICKWKDNFEKSILKFKEKLQFRENSMLFRFCCCEKVGGQEEDCILRKHFSSVILVQMDVNGEFGCNHIPSDTVDSGKSKKIFSEMQDMHGYTSTIVFITWGKRKK